MWSPDDLGAFGDGSVLEDDVLVFHPGHVEIGAGVYVGHRAILKGYHVNRLVIGDGTWIGEQCFLHAAGGIEIGRNVGIGPGVRIITSSHDEQGREVPILHSRIVVAAVVVEDDADIGVASVVLPGVTIGRGAQIGAGAVVTRDVPPYAVAAGVPARVLRYRPGQPGRHAMTTDVTIVIPTRERVRYLRVALHSVLASAAEASLQGITTRVLVVDDASPTDATARLCEELGVDSIGSRFTAANFNPAAAIVLGVSLVQSTWYSLFGDDDVMLPRFIPAQVAALRAGADVCTASFLRTSADLVTTREVILPEPALGDFLANAVTINDGAMTRTDLIRDLRWDASLAQQLLMPVWMELLYRGARFTRLTEPMFLYRRHDGNISNHVSVEEWATRQPIVDHYRAMVLERDGFIPEPTARPKVGASDSGPSPKVKPRRRHSLRSLLPWPRRSGQNRSSVQKVERKDI